MPLATAIKPAKSAVQDKATMVCNYAKDKAKKAAAYVKMNAQELQKFFAPSQRSSGTDETANAWGNATDPNDGNINRAANYDGNGNRAADSNDGDDRTNQVAYSACIAVSLFVHIWRTLHEALLTGRCNTKLSSFVRILYPYE